MKHILVLICLLFVAPLAHALDTTLTCSAPTQYTDDAPIVAGTAISFRLYGNKAGETRVLLDTKPACSFLRTNLSPGTLEYVITASIANIESDPSPTFVKVVPIPPPPKPKPPSSITATDVVAYEKRADGTMRVVGVVPMGSLCTAETVTAGTLTYNRVDANTVDTFVQPALPRVFWARCG